MEGRKEEDPDPSGGRNDERFASLLKKYVPRKVGSKVHTLNTGISPLANPAPREKVKPRRTTKEGKREERRNA